jgi:hypothetical protein
MSTMNRPLDVTSVEDGQEKMPNSQTIGTNKWRLVGKFVNPETNTMSSTKVLELPTGCLVETKHIEDGCLAVALVEVRGVTFKDFK